MDALNIIIPSYKRAGQVAGYDYFKSARICIPGAQKDDYLKHYDTDRLIIIPNESDGNVARKRNWILRNISRPLLMVDDDVKGLSMSEKGSRRRLKQNIALTPSQAQRVIMDGFNMAQQWRCVLWGVNVNTDGRNYQQYKPFSLTQMVLGPFQGHLQHDLYFDERMGTKDDYDFNLQALAKYRKILRLNKYAYDCLHGSNAGGIVSSRSQEREIKYCRAIMKKWGERVIKYRIPPRKMGDLLNGRVNVPISGV